MSLLLATAGELVAPPVDTFLMSKQTVLWPWLATAESGVWSHVENASSIFGGYVQSTLQNYYQEWSNVTLQAGSYTISYVGLTAANGGIGHVSFGGADTSARLDTYTAGTDYNTVVSDTFTVETTARGTIRIAVDSKNASSSSFRFRPCQIIIRKTSADSDAGSDLDNLPWFVDCPPVNYNATTGPATLVQTTSTAWGSYVRLSDAINEYTEYKVWLTQGTYTMSMVSVNGTSGGIATLTIDGGSSLGTVDTYNGSTTYNNVGTITSINVATTGIHTIRLTAATKNASSGGYNLDVAWIQFRKTSTTGEISVTGTTYGQETLELWPWFADTTDSDTFALSASDLHYGTFSAGTPAINDSQNYAVSIKPGTYDVDLVGQTTAASGIVHLSLDGGSDLDTVDLYSGSTVRNVTSTLSGSLSSGTINLNMDSKNASASDYDNNLTFARLVRTGA